MSPDRSRFLPPDLMAFSGQGNLVTLDSLRSAKARRHIIPLEEALGKLVSDDDPNLLISRTMQLPRAHMPIDAVALTYEMCVRSVPPLLYAIITHKHSYSVAEKAEILRQKRKEITAKLGSDESPTPIKTLTVEIEDSGVTRHFLLSGVGDFRINNQAKARLAEELGVSKSVMGRMKINPEEFDTTLFIGLLPGVVGPFVQPHLLGNLVNVIYLKNAGESSGFVALAVSPIDTFIVERPTFELLLDSWYGYNQNGIPFRTIEIGNN